MSRLARTCTVLLLVAAGSAGCAGDDDAPRDDAPADATEQADPGDSANDDDGRGGDDEDAPGRPELPIQVDQPKVFQNVHRSMELAGSAAVHEGELRWAILDADLQPMATGSTTASCGAPCRGTFSTTVPLAKVPVGSWELHVWQPPVADDDPARVHDTIVPITVTANPVDDDAPAPDAPPPGGVPDQ